MKRFLGVAGLAALMGANSTVMAGAEVAVAEKTILQGGVRAVRAAEAILGGNITSATALVDQTVAGVTVTQAEAVNLFAAASPLVQALRSSQVKATAADFDRIAEIVASDKSQVLPQVAIGAVAKAITDHKSLSQTAIAQELAVVSQDVANLMPSKIEALDDAEVMSRYVAETPAGEAAMAARSVVPEEEATRAKTLKTVLVNAATACPSGNTKACVDQGQKLVEQWDLDRYYQAGPRAEEFVADVAAGFPGLENSNASPEQFREGGYVSLTDLEGARIQGATMNENQAVLNGCWITGTPEPNYTTAN